MEKYTDTNILNSIIEKIKYPKDKGEILQIINGEKIWAVPEIIWNEF